MRTFIKIISLLSLFVALGSCKTSTVDNSHKSDMVRNVEELQKADRVIFPGVGEASYAMKMLKESGLDTLIPTLTQPVLGICLGMQLMCNHTEEGNTNGLGIFDTNVVQFSNQVKVPHMGWNTVEVSPSSSLFKGIEDQSFYFVHSYAAKKPVGISQAWSTHNEKFLAAVEDGAIAATQFHPEKSGEAGEQLLKNFSML